MQELLVILVCWQGQGCPEAGSTYYFYHPELALVAEQIKHQINPNILQALPLLEIAARQEMTLHHHKTSFTIKTDNIKIQYTKEF